MQEHEVEIAQLISIFMIRGRYVQPILSILVKVKRLVGVEAA